MKTMCTLTLVLAACVWAGDGKQAPPPAPILTLSLDLNPKTLPKRFASSPAVIHGKGFRVLQFHPGEDHHNHKSCDGVAEYEVYLDTADIIQSVTWHPEKPLPSQSLFPTKSSRFVANPAAKGAGVLLRELDNDRLLIANTLRDDAPAISEIVLMRKSSVGRFMPWLVPALKPDPARQ